MFVSKKPVLIPHTFFPIKPGKVQNDVFTHAIAIDVEEFFTLSKPYILYVTATHLQQHLKEKKTRKAPTFVDSFI